MEVIEKSSLKDRIAEMFLSSKIPFTKKRDVNWKRIGFCVGFGLLVAIVLLMLMPEPVQEQTEFHQSAKPHEMSSPANGDNTMADETTRQLESSRGFSNSVPSSLDGLYRQDSGGGMSSGQSQNRNSTMLIGRGDGDSKGMLPPGTRIQVRLYEKAIVENQGMPVIGIILKDVVYEDRVAIPEGSKIFGDVAFNDSSERAEVSFRTIRFPDGRERQISAIAVALDGQLGITGNVRSQALKNTVGQTLTRFIGAYAQGSMQTGSFGANQGGNTNGLRNAIAATAEDRANAWAEDMKKEKKWIELSPSDAFYGVLNQSFAFIDPGAIHGR